MGSTERHNKEPSMIVNVQHNSIDEYICAACVRTHAHECIHKVQQDMCLLVIW